MRYKYKLRSLLWFVAVCCLFFSWLGFAFRWIHLRHSLLVDTPVRVYPYSRSESPLAPGGLWLLGEKGAKDLWLMQPTDDTIEKAQKLYPEAELIIFSGGAKELPKWFLDMGQLDN